jgi:hypothetical protein
VIREYQANNGVGMVWPSAVRPELPLPDKDARHYALEALRTYLSQLSFQMTGVGNNTITVKIPIDSIYTEWPDDEELADTGVTDFPRVGFESVESNDEYPGFTPTEVFGTDDLYGKGTLLYMTSEHVETLEMHVLCRSIAERRAVLAGLTQALNPVQDFTGLNFTLTNYFNAPCRFTLEGGGRVEDPDAVKERRSIQLKLLLRVPNHFVARIERFVPQATVELDPETPVTPTGGPDGG